jgi:hypothetical protein
MGVFKNVEKIKTTVIFSKNKKRELINEKLGI